MSKVTLPLLGTVLGLGLIAVSFYWSSPLGPQPRWTEQQAEQHAASAAEYHRLAHQHGHSASPRSDGKPPAESPAVAVARKRWERQKAQLQAVRARHRRVATVLRWSGLVLAIGGVASFFLFGSADRNS